MREDDCRAEDICATDRFAALSDGSKFALVNLREIVHPARFSSNRDFSIAFMVGGANF